MGVNRLGYLVVDVACVGACVRPYESMALCASALGLFKRCRLLFSLASFMFMQL